MTEKEKKFIENYNKKIVSSEIIQKDFSVFFPDKSCPSVPVLIARKRRPTVCNNDESQKKSLFSSWASRSKKKSKLIDFDADIKIPEKLLNMLKVENLFDLALKIKYKYNEIICEEGKGTSFEYDPLTSPSNVSEEYGKIAVSEIRHNFIELSSLKKFFLALETLYKNTDDAFKRQIILVILENSPRIEFGNAFKDFLDNIFCNFLSLEKHEISDFSSRFYLSVTGLALATALMLKNSDLSLYFKNKILERASMEYAFSLDNKKVIWEFVTIMVCNLDYKDKAEVILSLREKIIESLDDKNTLNFLKYMNIDVEDLK